MEKERMGGASGAVDGIRRQQAALAAFGSYAFNQDDLQKILTEAARVCAVSLNVPYAKICQYRVQPNDLLIVAGYGWRANVVGVVVSVADESSIQGRAFVTGEPVIVEDITKSNSYSLPAFYAEHGILSTADVLIKGKDGSWGVLEVDSPLKRKFNQYDIIFLTGFANVVAEAVTSLERSRQLNSVIAKMKALISEKDELMSERTAREFRMRELQSELQHVSRLNAMGQMTAAIAHEVNQPLSAIANYVGAARRTLDAAGPDALENAKVLLEKAQEQTSRAGNVVRNLKDIVEKRECRRAAANIAVAVKDSLALVLFGAAPSEIDVRLEIDNALPAVLIDHVQIQQILINLIRNSIEAMSGASERRLTIVTCKGESGFVDVTVSDTGSGLAPNVSERLFQPFNTSKSDGMGLGLTICQTLVEANGGRIWRVEGVPVGAAFRFSLPIAPIDDAQSGSRAA
jgi:signal transduction histidine kinase